MDDKKQNPKKQPPPPQVSNDAVEDSKASYQTELVALILPIDLEGNQEAQESMDLMNDPVLPWDLREAEGKKKQPDREASIDVKESPEPGPTANDIFLPETPPGTDARHRQTRKETRGPLPNITQPGAVRVRGADARDYDDNASTCGCRQHIL